MQKSWSFSDAEQSFVTSLHTSCTCMLTYVFLFLQTVGTDYVPYENHDT